MGGDVTPPYGRVIGYEAYDREIELDKGAEMGRFNMGSTVIVLMEKNATIALNEVLKEGSAIKMGETLYKLCNLES